MILSIYIDLAKRCLINHATGSAPFLLIATYNPLDIINTIFIMRNDLKITCLNLLIVSINGHSFMIHHNNVLVYLQKLCWYLSGSMKD